MSYVCFCFLFFFKLQWHFLKQGRDTDVKNNGIGRKAG